MASRKVKRIRALLLGRALRAMRTTSVVAMGEHLEVELLRLLVVAAATASVHRLRCIGIRRFGSRHTRLPDDVLSDPVFEVVQDADKAEARWAIQSCLSNTRRLGQT